MGVRNYELDMPDACLERRLIDKLMEIRQMLDEAGIESSAYASIYFDGGCYISTKNLEVDCGIAKFAKAEHWWRYTDERES